MKNIILLLLFINCTAMFAQSDIATTPTDELYGYYKKGQSFETIQTEIKNYEALMAYSGYTFLRTNVISERDYKLFLSQKFDDGKVMQVTVRYQFLIPYFKINMENVRVVFSDGGAIQITRNDEQEMIRKFYEKAYDTVVLTLIKLINPAKTITKEQFREALDNLGTIPDFNSK